jgi:hypothetical protein
MIVKLDVYQAWHILHMTEFHLLLEASRNSENFVVTIELPSGIII